MPLASTADSDERFCSIALTLCPGIGYIEAKRLIDGAGSAANVFRQHKELPKLLPGVSSSIVTALDCPAAFIRAERKMRFMEKNRLTCPTSQNEAYPARLRKCKDASVVLFFKGNVDPNRLHIINVVGTRCAAEYGKQFYADFLHDLSALLPGVLVVSGLAYGIDIHTHRAALANDIFTVAVLAHGLDRICLSLYRKTAVDMLTNGGLLTEFLTEANPDKRNFVSRNCIVAGICDATIVVGSTAKGGSLIIADLAGGYHRGCFAILGRVTDTVSIDCNQLIRDSRAAFVQSAGEFVKTMGWTDTEPSVKAEDIQRSLFPELAGGEKAVARILVRQGDLHISTLAMETDIPVNHMSALLFKLEMKGVVETLAGGIYHLLT